MKSRAFALVMVLVLGALLPALEPRAAEYGSTPGSSGGPRQRGTLEWEAALLWWDSEYRMAGGVAELEEDNAGELGFRGAIWFPQHFGFVAQYLPTATEDVAAGAKDVTYISFDARYRLDTVSKNNYFAVGAGWEWSDLRVSDVFGRTNGPRAMGEFRLGTKMYFSYGEYTYMWKMSRINVDDTVAPDLRNIRGDEYEFGGGYLLGDHIELRMGYRQIEFRMERADGTRHTSQSKGYVAGLVLVC